jgi:hypothetical protein
MKQLILHIGMHKTGSTSIQNSFNGIQTAELTYADLGSANHSLPLYTAFADDPTDFHLHRRSNKTESEVLAIQTKLLEQLEQQLSGFSGQRLLISGEDMSRLPPSGVQRLKEVCVRYFDDIQVRAYVRTPTEFRTSMFQQALKGGLRCYEHQDPQYRFRFEKYQAIFGSTKVGFRLFAPARFPGQSVVQDFAQWIGVDPSQIVEKRANEGLPLEAAQLLMLFNATQPPNDDDPRQGKARRMLIELLSSLYPTPFRLPDSVACHQLDEADIGWMEEAGQMTLMPSPSATTSLSPSQFDEQLRVLTPTAIVQLQQSQLQRPWHAFTNAFCSAVRPTATGQIPCATWPCASKNTPTLARQ